jgi:NADP-dependent 3-hydroxy acid dehydrogenase YdfG
MTQRTIVVSGASAGIGAATARLLAERGFAVVAGARRADRLRELGKGVEGFALDVTDDALVGAFVRAIESAHGHVDGLVNCAGLALGNAFFKRLVGERMGSRFRRQRLRHRAHDARAAAASA